MVLGLFGDVAQGYPTSALARAVGCSPQVITRDLDNLRTAGLAERDEETGLWRLTPQPACVALDHHGQERGQPRCSWPAWWADVAMAPKLAHVRGCEVAESCLMNKNHA